MENFSNQTINIQELPKFEEVEFTALNPKYLKVIFLNLIFVVGLFILVPIVIYLVKPTFFSNRVSLILGALIPLTLGLILSFTLTAFKKRGFAFREHDVMYKSGIISNTTIIIPYNRVQHVALHQGFISRKFGLASVEIFTAGGRGSDLEIPGIMIDEAQKIKQLVMKKINATDINLQNTSSENSNLADETS